MLRQQRGLKGKQAQHMVHAALHGAQTLGAPGPDRGAHKVHGFNAARPQARLQRQVEIRRVHAYKQPGRVRGQATIQGIADADDFAVAKQHVPAKAVHGQLVVRPPGLKPLGSHLRAADAGRLQPRPAHAQRLQQQPSEHVARGFAGHHGQIQGGACSHLPRPI